MNKPCENKMGSWQTFNLHSQEIYIVLSWLWLAELLLSKSPSCLSLVWRYPPAPPKNINWSDHVEVLLRKVTTYIQVLQRYQYTLQIYKSSSCVWIEDLLCGSRLGEKRWADIPSVEPKTPPFTSIHACVNRETLCTAHGLAFDNCYGHRWLRS